jgi:abequosyltransferase
MLEESLLMYDKKSEPLISIVIPTFNQAKFLDYFLSRHALLLKNFNIPIIISDNASSDETEVIVKKWQKKSSLILYNCNLNNIGYGRNVLLALGYSKTKYTWLMGDTYSISIDLIKAVLSKIKKLNDLDFLVINLEGMIKKIPSQSYTDQNRILSDLGGIMTCLSCLIFHEKIIKSNISEHNSNKHFIHLEIILRYISNKDFKAVWISNESVRSLKHPTIKKINWSHKVDVLEIGFRKWVEFVSSLPPTFSTKDKSNCIRSFGKLSKLGTLRGFLLIRMRGNLTLESYIKYKTEIDLMRTIPIFLVRLIILIPSPFLRLICVFITKIFRVKSELCS